MGGETLSGGASQWPLLCKQALTLGTHSSEPLTRRLHFLLSREVWGAGWGRRGAEPL